MIPEERLSTTVVLASFQEPQATGDPFSDVEYGGVALNDASQGLQVKLWTLRYDRDSGDMIVSAEGVTPTVLFNRPAITQVALAFDRNMSPVVCFVQAGQAKMYYYDDLVPGFIFQETLLGDAITPRCTHDDKRSTQSDKSDVIVAYVRGSKLYYRQQRDRYLIERELLMGGVSIMAAGLHSVGMNDQWRLQFAYDGGGEPIDPYLADVVADLLNRSKIKQQHIDVSQLWVPIGGLRIANEGNAAAAIAAIQPAYFFDPGAWDKKMRFVMRGGEPVAHLTFDDLRERNGVEGPLEKQLVQEYELLRKVNVTMIDSSAGWIPNKQTAERRSATIQAIGESSNIVPITATPDFIATVAAKRLRIPWGEPSKFKFGLGIPWTQLTPTDVITLEDRRGRVFRMRLSQHEEDYGSLAIEANSDAKWIYKLTAKGVSAPPIIPTVPGQVGDTVVWPVDIPVMRDQDDELGYYVAVYGTGNGWSSGVVQISLDGGATVTQTIGVDVPAVVGGTLTALLPEVSSEYLSSQVLRITLSEQPSSVDRAGILRYKNLCAVQRADGTWEVLQFQTATMVSDGVYDLSGLVRGRYATEPLAVPIGAHFVMIDDSVTFVRLQQWMLGMTISYRGVSDGQNPDDVDWESFVADDPQSQMEWPVHHVQAERDVSDNVTVSWIGRGRLGIEIAPRNSKYFNGYRVTYSDGYTADTTAMTHTRATTPAGVTVTVAAINTITGLGPSSEGILI